MPKEEYSYHKCLLCNKPIRDNHRVITIEDTIKKCKKVGYLCASCWYKLMY